MDREKDKALAELIRNEVKKTSKIIADVEKSIKSTKAACDAVKKVSIPNNCIENIKEASKKAQKINSDVSSKIENLNSNIELVKSIKI